MRAWLLSGLLPLCLCASHDKSPERSRHSGFSVYCVVVRFGWRRIRLGVAAPLIHPYLHIGSGPQETGSLRDFLSSSSSSQRLTSPLLKMALQLLGAAWILLHVMSPQVSAGEDCLWYQDHSGGWHSNLDCKYGTFCCGDCYQRYCCFDPSKLITERMQKGCLSLSPKTIAGIGFAVLLFFVVIVTLICCFMCSCCYLYQRRHQRSTPYRAQEIQMSGVSQQPLYPTQPPYPTQVPYPTQPPYPMQPPYPPQPYPMDPKFAPPQPGYEPVPMYPASGPTSQYPVYSPAPPMYNPNFAGPPPNTMYPGQWQQQCRNIISLSWLVLIYWLWILSKEHPVLHTMWLSAFHCSTMTKTFFLYTQFSWSCHRNDRFFAHIVIW